MCVCIMGGRLKSKREKFVMHAEQCFVIVCLIVVYTYIFYIWVDFVKYMWANVLNAYKLTIAQDVLVMRLQLFNCISVPLRRTTECICGQKPLVRVKHHSPHDAHGHWAFGIWRSIVWHITGSNSKPDLKALSGEIAYIYEYRERKRGRKK